MIWQDIVITVVNYMFGLFLIPMLRSPNKPPLKSSGTTALGLFIMCFAFATLGLWLSAVAVFITASAWLTLFIQGIRGKHQGR